MTCPKCEKQAVEEIYEEVDIGVGIQRHLYGLFCPDCGEIAICSTCGMPDCKPHQPYCANLKSDLEEEGGLI